MNRSCQRCALTQTGKFLSGSHHIALPAGFHPLPIHQFAAENGKLSGDVSNFSQCERRRKGQPLRCIPFYPDGFDAQSDARFTGQSVPGTPDDRRFIRQSPFGQPNDRRFASRSPFSRPKYRRLTPRSPFDGPNERRFGPRSRFGPRKYRRFAPRSPFCSQNDRRIACFSRKTPDFSGFPSQTININTK